MKRAENWPPADQQLFVGSVDGFYRPDRRIFAAGYLRERARMRRIQIASDTLSAIFLLLAALALLLTRFTPEQLKKAWLLVPFALPPMMIRVCAWCDAVIGEKCGQCGEEAAEIASEPGAAQKLRQRFRCQSKACGFEFERDPQKVTHGICPRCVAKKASERAAELACEGKAVRA